MDNHKEWTQTFWEISFGMIQKSRDEGAEPFEVTQNIRNAQEIIIFQAGATMERNAFAQNLVMEWLNKELEGRKKGKWNIFLDETLINHASRDCRKMPEIANFLIQWWHESKKSPRPLLTDFEAESIDAWLDASKVQPQASPKPALTQFPEKTALTVASNQETSKLKKSIAE